MVVVPLLMSKIKSCRCLLGQASSTESQKNPVSGRLVNAMAEPVSVRFECVRVFPRNSVTKKKHNTFLFVVKIGCLGIL